MTPTPSLAGRSFASIRRNLFSVYLAALWPYLVVVTIFITINVIVRHTHPAATPFDPAAFWRGMSFVSKLGVFVGFAALTQLPLGFAIGGISLVVYQDCCGRKMSLANALKELMRRSLPLAVLCMVIGCAAVFGAVFVVPAIAVGLLTVFAVPVMLLEETGIMQALRRSVSLAWQHIGTVLVTVFLFGASLIVMWIFFAVITTSILRLEDMSGAVAFWLLFGVGMPILVCVYGTALTILYHDACASSGEKQAVSPAA